MAAACSNGISPQNNRAMGLSLGEFAKPVRGRCNRHDWHTMSSVGDSRAPHTIQVRGDMRSSRRVSRLIFIFSVCVFNVRSGHAGHIVAETAAYLVKAEPAAYPEPCQFGVEFIFVCGTYALALAFQ